MTHVSIAQVSTGYNFSAANGTLGGNLTGGTLLASGGGIGAPTDDAVFPNQPIGFNFKFNGVSYTSLGVSTNGFIWFGNTAPPPNEYDPVSSTNAYERIVAAFARDLTGMTAASELRIQTAGTAPNRTLVVNWKRFVATNVFSSSNNRMDLYVVLYECSGIIKTGISANEYQWTTGVSTSGQVGLRGSSNADFFNRNITCGGGGWLGSSAGASNAATGTMGGGAFSACWPGSGGFFSAGNPCVYTYTPTVSDLPVLVCTNPSPLCSNAAGAVAVNVTGGTTPYNFNWTFGGAATPAPASGSLNNATVPDASSINTTFSNAGSGTYSITVTDGAGCQSTCSGTITVDNCNTNTITTGAVAGSPFCAGATFTVPFTSTGTFNAGNVYTVQLSDASGSFATPVSIGTLTSSANSGNISVTLPAGTTAGTGYRVRVISSNPAATGSDNGIDLNIPGLLTSSLSVSNPSCGQNNGSITNTVTNGNGPYQFIWSNGATTQSLTNTGSGTYNVTVTSSNNCTATASVSLTGSQAIVMGASVVTTANCNQSTGTATATVTSGSSPYTYNWSNGQTTSTATGLAAGTYMVTVTSVNGCSGSATATVTSASAPEILVTSTTSSCNNNNGTATVTVSSGGAAPFTYSWSNNGTTQTISNLGAGSYNVTVTDANNCQASGSALVGSVPPPVVSLSATNASCGSSNGGVTSGIAGGAGPFTYSWNPAATTQSLSNVPAGTYSLTVTGASGCTTSAVAVVADNGGATLSETHTDPSCNQTNGSINITASGGATPYTFLWSTNATTEDLSNLGAGTFTVTVTSSNSCSSSATVTLVTPNAPTLTAVTTDPTCGQNNGSIAVTPVGGTPAFAFVWNTGETTSGLSNVAAGLHAVTATDANGCTVTQSFNLVTTSNPVISSSVIAASCGNNNGSVNLTITSGTQPFTFAWSNGATSEDISLLAAATYTVTVSSSDNCTATASVTVGGSGGPSASASSTDAGCAGNNGSVTLNVSGGITPYSFSWSNGFTQQNLTNAGSGTYSVTVSDANNCTTTATANVGSTNGPSLSATSIDATCGANNGGINLTVTGGAPPYGFSWSNGMTSQNITGVAPGSYSVTVTDNSNCSTTISSVVAGGTALVLQLTATEADCGAANGSIGLVVSGGTTPCNYEWSNGSQDEDVLNLTAGNYNVTVIDAAGCSATGYAVISNNNGPLVTSVVADELCLASNGLVDISVSGGAPPFTFLWSDGTTEEDKADLTGGSYNVTVTDASGCSTVQSFTINAPLPGTVTLAGMRDVACAGDVFEVTASGSDAYVWSPETGLGSTTGSTVTFTALLNTVYTVTGTDANGCVAIDSFDLTVEPRAMIVGAQDPYTACSRTEIQLECYPIYASDVIWHFSDGTTTNGATPGVTLNTGVYDVTLIAVSEIGCNDTVHLDDYITATRPPTALFSRDSVVTDASIPPVTFNFLNLSADGAQFNWIFGDGTSDTVTNPVHTFPAPGFYNVSLIAMNESGCVDTFAKLIEVGVPGNVFIPNSFSPNGDGINELFSVYSDGILSFRMRVYDKWGEAVFDSRSGGNAWDGTFRGKRLNTGVYVYIVDVELLNGYTFRRSGDVTLLR